MSFFEQTITLIVIFCLIAGPFIILAMITFAVCKRIMSSQKTDQFSKEEAQLMQELHQNMTRLEKRIESLETLLLENEKTKSDI